MSALDGIDTKLHPFQELANKMETRAKMKLDFDAYTHKVCPLSSPTSNGSQEVFIEGGKPEREKRGC